MARLNKEAAFACWKKNIEVYKLVIYTFTKVLDVAKKYDGKVLNKRFITALNAVSPDVSFKLNYDSYQPTVEYQVSFDARKYVIIQGGSQITQCTEVCGYDLSISKRLGRYDSDILPYIAYDSRRLDYLAFVESMKSVVDDLLYRIAETEKAISEYDEVIAEAKRINVEIQKLKKAHPFSGFCLERDRLEFWRLSY